MSRRCLIAVVALSGLALLPAVASSGSWSKGQLEVAGRGFPESPAYPGQRSHNGSLQAQAEYYAARGRHSFVVTPRARLDSADPERNLLDLQEAYWHFLGEGWEIKTGFDLVFWGVVESWHLVDIINQVDLVGSPDREEKLGQPMVQLSWSGGWGLLDLFLLTGFREQPFPGREGRLRPAQVVNEDASEFQSDAGRNRLDQAIRYRHHWGPVDIGVAYFHGINRDPFLIPELDRGRTVLEPYYETIRQVSLDAQLTLDAWLWKLEVLHREDSLDRLGQREDYWASVIGLEYTFFDAWRSGSDVGLLLEYLWDERGVRSRNAFEDDVFLAGRLALNDLADTTILVGAVSDLDRDALTWRVEAATRFSESWSGRLDVTGFAVSDPEDPNYELRHDSYLEVALSFWF